MTKDAIFQFEIDVPRGIVNIKPSFNAAVAESPWDRIYNIAKTAACDTIRNGGTFVLVVTDDKITMVQQATAADISDRDEPPLPTDNPEAGDG